MARRNKILSRSHNKSRSAVSTIGNIAFCPVNDPWDGEPVRATTQELEESEHGSQQAEGSSVTPALPAGKSTFTAVNDTEDSEPVHETAQELEQSEHGSQQVPGSSVTRSIPLHSSLPSLLPDHIFTSSFGKLYDRDWMTKHGVDERILAGFSSKAQFRSLLVNGAIKVGDRLRLTYDSDNGAVHKEGTITKGLKNWRPDITIPSSRTGGALITLHGCAGPLDFLNAMNAEFGDQYGCVSGGWRAVNLINSYGRDMGTLWKVRQAYHIWIEEKDKWAFRNNQPLSNHGNSTNPRPSTDVPKARKPKGH